MSKKIDAHCPYCGLTMRTSAMRCSACDVEVQGRFEQPLLGMLKAEDQQLLEDYMLTGFSIKELENRTGMGYAAIRSRLDKLITRYQSLKNAEEEKQRLLQMVSNGELTAAEAAARIKKITRQGK
jgi:hypothetical protein